MKLKLLVVLLFPMSVLADNDPANCVGVGEYSTIVTQCNDGVVTAIKGGIMVVCNPSYDQDLPPVCTKVSLDTE